jgi:hypothetical protein
MKITLHLLVAILFVFLVPFNSSWAEYKPQKSFSLSDGTTIKGELIGIRQNDGAYLIETASMGTVAIHPQDVVSMANDTVQAQQPNIQQPPAQASSEAISPANIQKTQEMLLSDPSIAQSIQELMSDPEIMELLKDPQVMQAVMSMDPQVIQSNPKIQQLLQNPAMQKIIQQSGQKLMQQTPP